MSIGELCSFPSIFDHTFEDWQTFDQFTEVSVGDRDFFRRKLHEQMFVNAHVFAVTLYSQGKS